MVLHTPYWIVLGELTDRETRWRSGPTISVRPPPPGYEAL